MNSRRGRVHFELVDKGHVSVTIVPHTENEKVKGNITGSNDS